MATTKTKSYGIQLWEQVCDELQHHHKQQLERRVQHAAHQARHQWRRWHIAPALQRTRGVHALRLHAHLCSTLDDDTAHLMAQVLSPFIVIHGHIHGAFSLTRSLPSSFTFSSCPSPSSSSSPSCSLSSTTRKSWQVCVTPLQKRVRIPWTPSPLPHIEDPVAPLERNLYGHPLAGLLLERKFEKILLKYGWEKVSNWECLFVHREKGLFLSVLWMTSNWLEGNKTLIRSGKYSIKKSNWENQHISLIMEFWGALKDNVK